jgi:hypothetical protein
MKDSVEVDELPDSFGVVFELEVDVSNLTGEGLGSFEDLSGNSSDEGFVLFFVKFLDLCLEIFNL